MRVSGEEQSAAGHRGAKQGGQAGEFGHGEDIARGSLIRRCIAFRRSAIGSIRLERIETLPSTKATVIVAIVNLIVFVAMIHWAVSMMDSIGSTTSYAPPAVTAVHHPG